MPTRSFPLGLAQRPFSKRLILLATLGVAVSASLLSQPAITFEEKAVVARGLSPGGQAVLFGVAREPQGFHSRVVRRAHIATADGAGEARLDLEQPVPARSIWLAADLVSGLFRTATPGGSPAKEIVVPVNAIETLGPGRSGRVRSDLGFIEILYIRPLQGAWVLAVGDGGESDEDRAADSSIAAALDRMAPVGSSPAAPADFVVGDILLVVDPRELQFFAARLGPGGLGS